MNSIKYYLYFRKDLFKTVKIIYIGKGLSKNWSLSEGSDPIWNYIPFFTVKDKKEIEISESFFNSLMSIKQMDRYYINKCNSPIELLKRWNLLDDIAELLI
jgi:hypothetical protein